MSTTLLKVRQNRNVFFKRPVDPKNKRKIFSIAMGAEYLSCVKSIATFAPTFYGYIISILASVLCVCFFLHVSMQ